MKSKLMLHYLLSFILACSIIFIVNIVYMRNNVYKEGALYNYYPEKTISSFKKYIELSSDYKVGINEKGKDKLEKDDIGLQILDENNNETFSYNKPTIAKKSYSNKALIDIYNNKNKTVFIDEKIIDGNTYTYLIFLDNKKVKRINYAYDVSLIKKAHNFPVLVTMNIILILVMSLLFTSRITKPIRRIIDKILNLSNGNYSINDIDDGIYFKVETCLNELGKRLESNEKERKQLDKMREDWISNITHDIKTPLTSIIGNAEIMADTDYELEDDVRVKYCSKILSKSEYIKTLVEDLNLSTRLKSNTLILNKRDINIVSLIRHLLINIINDEKYNHNNIKFIYSKEDIFLNVDEQLMKRVFINLITNSFIHNSEDVNIEINIAELSDKEVNICITDNGKGISKEELDHIFNRFYRGTNTSKKTEGSGLGMAIAHDIIKAHNANIKVNSNLNTGLKIDISFTSI